MSVSKSGPTLLVLLVNLAVTSAQVFPLATPTRPTSFPLPAASRPSLPGTVVTWGSDASGQRTVPTGLTNAVAIAAGAEHSLALRADGAVAAWGWNEFGQSTIPPAATNLVAVSAGDYHSIALRSDGVVLAWGDNSYGQSAVPAGLGSVVAITAGSHNSLALRSDGTIVANDFGQRTPPAGLSSVVQVAGGGTHCLALKSDGSVVGWGGNFYGEAAVPVGLSNVLAVACGSYHSLALRNDGTVAAWGDNSWGQSTIPTGLSNVVVIAGGESHSLALKADGKVVAWGRNLDQRTNVPPSFSGGFSVDGGDRHSISLALLPPSITGQPQAKTTNAGSTVVFSVTAAGTAPLDYQWFHQGQLLAGATNPTLSLPNIARAQGGAYYVVVTNLIGSTNSSNAIVRVLAPTRLLPPEFAAGAPLRLRFGEDGVGGVLTTNDAGNFEVHVSTNATGTNWLRLNVPLTVTNGQIVFEDGESVGLPRRFYRVIER
jgi:alpha-tubulin suppressor-like RCC1 family protein